jgi:hypothetical protein
MRNLSDIDKVLNENIQPGTIAGKITDGSGMTVTKIAQTTPGGWDGFTMDFCVSGSIRNGEVPDNIEEIIKKTMKELQAIVEKNLPDLQ